MDWIPLLAATARLLDMHDSTRASGDSTHLFNLYREVRSGHPDGLWLDVALTTIEYLRARESEVIGGFVSGAELAGELHRKIPSLTAEDIRFVLSALTTPSEIWFVERSDIVQRPLKSTKDTNLVERSRSADAYRLAPAGRTAIALAANVRDIAYIAGSAKNLLTAIRAGDFWKITELSTAISDVLRSFRFDIESRRESGQHDELREFFLQRSEIIREQIAEAAHILVQAREFLGLQSTREAFVRWADTMDRNNQASFGHGYAIENLRQVAAQTLRLLESFTALVEDSMARRAETFRPVSFITLSTALATQPYRESLYMALITGFGPIRHKRANPCPFDFLGVFDLAVLADLRNEDMDSVGAEAHDTRAIRFVAEYGEAIIAELRDRPLPLAEALRRGWIDIDTHSIDDIGALLGTYCDPSLLGTDLNITVRLGTLRDVFAGGTIGQWTFDELVMILEEA
ncbi:MAG TPA: hypothetical protein VEC35_20910 [Noviherbaspirillum sp.]|nr:hypothetical protein [Noviherbaspirillum sp.]